MDIVREFKNGWTGKGWLQRQWPWWTAGLLTATAEVINYWFVPLGHAKHKFIGVTSGMARMYAAFESTLFGGSLIATKADYQPSIQWVIIGAMIAALVLTWLEGEWRSWARYPKPLLAMTVLGGALFAWGTRVAGGCTLHHLLGGFSAFNMKSFVVMTSATVGALLAFIIFRKLQLSQYFKSQDTKWYVAQARERGWADGLTYSEKNPYPLLTGALLAFLVLFLVVILYNAFAGNDFAVNAFGVAPEKTKMAKMMLTAANLPNVLLLLLIGALLGTSVAKTGFGTECGLINPEMGREVHTGEKHAARRWGMPLSLRTVFGSMQPFGALALHTAIVAFSMWIGFTVFGIMEGHHWATPEFAANYVGPEFHNVSGPGLDDIREKTTWPMDIFGGLLLGLGTVFMIGCEFRNYGRTGLLYLTGLLIWPAFYLGYLPYTLARDFWDNLMGNYIYGSTTFVPAALAPQSPGMQSLIYLLYVLFWAYMFWWAARKGAQFLGVAPGRLLSMTSEDMVLQRIEKLKAEGRYEEIDQLERELADEATKD
ncbi:YeeE/YedE thiosulfate transporter family protein [Oceanithermus sp.]